jgi:hypothetical protein
MAKRQMPWLEIAGLALPLLVAEAAVLTAGPCFDDRQQQDWSRSALLANGSLLAIGMMLLNPLGRVQVVPLAIPCMLAVWLGADPKPSGVPLALALVVQALATVTLLGVMQASGQFVLRPRSFSAEWPAQAAILGLSLAWIVIMAIRNYSLSEPEVSAAYDGSAQEAVLVTWQIIAVGALLTPAAVASVLRRQDWALPCILTAIAAVGISALVASHAIDAPRMPLILLPQVIVMMGALAGLRLAGYRMVSPPLSFSLAREETSLFVPARRNLSADIGVLGQSLALSGAVPVCDFLRSRDAWDYFFENFGGNFWPVVVVAAVGILAVWAVVGPRGGPRRFFLVMLLLLALQWLPWRPESYLSDWRLDERVLVARDCFHRFLATGFWLFLLSCLGLAMHQNQFRRPRPCSWWNGRRRETPFWPMLLAAMLLCVQTLPRLISNFHWTVLLSEVRLYTAQDIVFVACLWAANRVRRRLFKATLIAAAAICLLTILPTLAGWCEMANPLAVLPYLLSLMLAGLIVVLAVWIAVSSMRSLPIGTSIPSRDPASRSRVTLRGLLGWTFTWAAALAALQYVPPTHTTMATSDYRVVVLCVVADGMLMAVATWSALGSSHWFYRVAALTAAAGLIASMHVGILFHVAKASRTRMSADVVMHTAFQAFLPDLLVFLMLLLARLFDWRLEGRRRYHSPGQRGS